MFFEDYKSILFSDTLLPDIFISEYLPSMDGDHVKIYIYCTFLCKYGKKVSAEELTKKLGIEVDKVKDALTRLEVLGIINRKNNNIIMVDLKEKEVFKRFRLKSTSTPEEAIESSERNIARNKIISAINKTFFQGLMPPSWYTDIDAWFDKYQFDEDVMYALFSHCYEHNGLAKNYIIKVADSWHSKNIKNSFDLDRYFIQYQKLKDVRLKVLKKLKMSRLLTEYEENFLEKWLVEYGYGFDVIELALRKTTATPNPSFNYINAILNNWYKIGLKTKEEILASEKAGKANKAKSSKSNSKKQIIPQHANFEQREYDENHFENFYEDI
jgi:DnaD/phage-associated family protein